MRDLRRIGHLFYSDHSVSRKFVIGVEGAAGEVSCVTEKALRLAQS